MSLPSQLVPATWDVGIFVLLWALGFFWCASQGTRLIKTLTIALYVSTAMALFLPIERVLSSVRYTTLVGYGVVATLLFALVAYILSKTIRPEATRVWWKGFFLSAILAGFFTFYLFHQIPAGLLHASPLALSLLTGMWQTLFWAIVPLVGILLF